MEEIKYEKLISVKDNCNLLIFTATEIETKSLHAMLKPIPGLSDIVKSFKGNQTYYIGSLGKYVIVHTECTDMGSVGRGSSLNTANDAIDAWNPKGVIMVGVAFGVDEKKQQYGDVLISKSIQHYDNKRVGKKETVQRATEPPSSANFYNRFTNIRDWNKKGLDGKVDLSIIPGPLLSGESLIDDIDTRDDLVSSYPTAIGGEMEGAGIYAAASNKNVEWILIKAICDYADGKKSVDKKIKQKLAAESAVDFLQHALQSEFAFEELMISPINNKVLINHNNSVSSSEIGGVLFDIYEKKYEDYYFVRDLDNIVSSYIIEKSIWLSGISGCGKSSIVRRALYDDGENQFTYVTLENCVGKNNIELFREIHSQIADCFSCELIFDENNLIKSVSDLLIKIGEKQDKIKLNIDEIPLESDVYNSFFETLFGVLIKVRTEAKVQLVISCIEDPKAYLKPYNEKITELIHFMHLEQWDENVFSDFFDFLVNKLNLTFDSNEKLEILNVCKNNPRKLKTFLRNFIVVGEKLDNDVSKVLTFCDL